MGGRRDDLGAVPLGVVGAAPDHAARRQPAARAGCGLPAGDRGLRLRHDHAGRRDRWPACVDCGAGARPARRAPGPRARRAARAWSPSPSTSRACSPRRSTARETEYGGFGGKFTTDPLALFASVLPTAAVHGHDVLTCCPTPTSPGCCRSAAGWTGAAPARVGGRSRGCCCSPWSSWRSSTGRPRSVRCGGRCGCSPSWCRPLAVLLVVAWTRFGLARPSPLRLGLSLGWVVLAGALTIMRTSSDRAGDLCSVALVAAALTLLWWLVRSGRRAWLAPVAGAVTLAAFGRAARVLPDASLAPAQRADGSRGLPEPLSRGRRRPAPGRVPTDLLVQSDPAAARQLPIGSAWYLNRPHVAEHLHGHQPGRVQGTATASTTRATPVPRCSPTLFSTEPTTGQKRVDLLGVSSLLLVRDDFPHGAADPPAGRAGASPSARRTPCCGRGVRRCPAQEAWPGRRRAPRSRRSTPGRPVRRSASTGCRPRAGRSCCGLLDWPGYSTSSGVFGGSGRRLPA